MLYYLPKDQLVKGMRTSMVEFDPEAERMAEQDTKELEKFRAYFGSFEDAVKLVERLQNESRYSDYSH